MVLVPYLRVLFLEWLFTVQYVIEQVNWVILSWRHTVVSLPCTNLSSAVKRLKESDLVVTQPSNIFGGDFDFIKRYFFWTRKKTRTVTSLVWFKRACFFVWGHHSFFSFSHNLMLAYSFYFFDASLSFFKLYSNFSCRI